MRVVSGGRTAKPRMNMLTVRVLRIEDVLWNSTFMMGIPGAMTDDVKGLELVSYCVRLDD